MTKRWIICGTLAGVLAACNMGGPWWSRPEKSNTETGASSASKIPPKSTAAREPAAGSKSSATPGTEQAVQQRVDNYVAGFQADDFQSKIDRQSAPSRKKPAKSVRFRWPPPDENEAGASEKTDNASADGKPGSVQKPAGEAAADKKTTEQKTWEQKVQKGDEKPESSNPGETNTAKGKPVIRGDTDKGGGAADVKAAKKDETKLADASERRTQAPSKPAHHAAKREPAVESSALGMPRGELADESVEKNTSDRETKNESTPSMANWDAKPKSSNDPDATQLAKAGEADAKQAPAESAPQSAIRSPVIKSINIESSPPAASPSPPAETSATPPKSAADAPSGSKAALLESHEPQAAPPGLQSSSPPGTKPEPEHQPESPTRANPAAAPNGGEPSIKATIQELEQKVAGQPNDLEQQFRLRMLYLADGQDAKALAESPGMNADLQEIMRGLIRSLVEARSSAGRDPAAWATKQLQALEEVRALVSPKADLNVPTIKLCTKIDGFGLYDPIEPAEFPVGRTSEAVLYVEVDNYRTDKTPKGDYRTLMAMRTTLLKSSGEEIWSAYDDNVEDLSRRPRKDFFLTKKVSVPDKLAAGTYTLKVEIEDKLAGKVNSNTMNFQVTAKVATGSSTRR